MATQEDPGGEVLDCCVVTCHRHGGGQSGGQLLHQDQGKLASVLFSVSCLERFTLKSYPGAQHWQDAWTWVGASAILRDSKDHHVVVTAVCVLRCWREVGGRGNQEAGGDHRQADLDQENPWCFGPGVAKECFCCHCERVFVHSFLGTSCSILFLLQATLAPGGILV